MKPVLLIVDDDLQVSFL